VETNLTGKVALVTGTGSQTGFGRGIAEVLAGEGCDIVANSLNLERAETTATKINALGRKAIAIQADVTKKEEVSAMVEKALAVFGKIDILVNNAGASHPLKPFVDTPESDWDEIIDLNLYGTLNCIKVVLPHMIQRNRGKIINISSGGGISGTPGFVLYGASKAAIIVFTKGLAKEVISSGIYVNCIAPGIGDTNFPRVANFPADEFEKLIKLVPTGKSTTPEDIGNMVAYLASDLSNNIVGQTFLVDGGLSLH
jgi:NAD(P)-dependent dehydrogenase (short-subunit alcohol dehydrogenase family)